jgi:hypothetical protein
MESIFHASEEKPQARCSASCEDFNEAGAEKTSKPGKDGQFDQKQSIIIGSKR